MGEFFAEGEFVSLTVEQRELLDKWAILTPEQKQLILDMINSLSKI